MDAYPQNSYVLPEFADQRRFEKIKLALPKIRKIYEDYAIKNHFPAVIQEICVELLPKEHYT